MSTANNFIYNYINDISDKFNTLKTLIKYPTIAAKT